MYGKNVFILFFWRQGSWFAWMVTEAIVSMEFFFRCSALISSLFITTLKTYKKLAISHLIYCLRSLNYYWFVSPAILFTSFAILPKMMMMKFWKFTVCGFDFSSHYNDLMMTISGDIKKTIKFSGRGISHLFCIISRIIVDVSLTNTLENAFLLSLTWSEPVSKNAKSSLRRLAIFFFFQHSSHLTKLIYFHKKINTTKKPKDFTGKSCLDRVC